MHTNHRLTDYFLAVILFGAVSGCQQSDSGVHNNETQHPSEAKPAMVKKVSTSKIVALNEPLTEALQRGATYNATKKSALSPAITDQAPTKDSRLVEELGFSNVNNPFNATTPGTDDLFCLKKATRPPLESIKQACQQISDRLASVQYKNCLAAKLESTDCTSVKGFPMLVREFPPLSGRNPNGRVLVIGGTHGDELTTVSVVMRWINQLSNNHSGLFHWRIAPLMNPDAVLKSAATRTNHRGVDLNRNMPSDDWDEKALTYWHEKSNDDKRKYPGPKPASEPETQWLIDEINHFKPDAIISVHAPYGVVDFDSLLLNTAPKSLGKLHLNLLGTYPGSLGNYAGINRNIPVITLELPHSWEMPSIGESNEIWEDIVQWLKKNVNQDSRNR